MIRFIILLLLSLHLPDIRFVLSEDGILCAICMLNDVCRSAMVEIDSNMAKEDFSCGFPASVRHCEDLEALRNKNVTCTFISQDERKHAVSGVYHCSKFIANSWKCCHIQRPELVI